MKYIDYLKCCDGCPRKCRVDRTAGPLGYCRSGSGIPVAYSGLHFGEEPPISGTAGSGTIFFAGCNLRCIYCQNWQISQEFNINNITKMQPHQFAEVMLDLQKAGAHNINLVSPSHVIYQVVYAIEIAREKGLKIPIVYNSNGYDSVASLKMIRGLIDIYLPDIKYADPFLSARYSDVSDYDKVIPEALREMFEQVGPLNSGSDGIARSGLLVRHLVLPGAVENSLDCLDIIAGISRKINLSIMSQYSPAYKAFKVPDINRNVSRGEYERVVSYAEGLGFENIFTQKRKSQDLLLPDFSNEEPFR